MSAAATGRRGLPFADVAARLHILDGGSHRFVVILARPPLEPTPSVFQQKGRAGGVLAHDVGVTWPDIRGVAVARALLHGGGAVGLAFVALADALACHRHIVAGTRP